ncbi:TIGR02680 family protein [Kribbella solani]|uniref:TIGR02680 family protein n=1 Tax=Kribbella solani TaxID=236067 RepID=UPI0029A7B5D8|nr:TIGR02680 family protein [Kribbella solani]MDX2971359.1 TIGR02680 family protein [Kribbella solani]
MTVTLPARTEPSAGLEDQVPIHHPDRWRLHRAGITNVWYYYDNEFDFSGGRMILRGTNGSGKSRALEMLLPFVLDADRRRMDSTGSGTVKLETLMRYGGEEQTNRLGYLWLELVRGNDEPEYLTIGALIRYSSSTTRAKVWYFITPLRVGEDLVLLDPTRHPLGLKNLTELIGEENLTESPTIHSDRVAHRVFGLSGQSGKERYSGLLQLLHTLRSPDVGNRIEDNKLAKILSDALPPLSDQALDTAGSHLDSLSEARQAQQDLIKTQAQVRTFMTTYRRYVRTLLSTAIKAVESQAGTVRVAAKAAGDLRQKSGQLRLDARTEDEKAEQLESTAGDLKAAIEGWTKLPAYQAGMQLEGLVDQAAALETALQAQIQASRSMREAEAESVGAANRSGGELTQAVDAVEELRSACREALLRAGVPVGALPGPIRSTRSEAEPTEELVQLSADDAELLARPRPDVMTVTPDDLEGAAAAAGTLKDSAQQRASAATNRLATARKLVREQAAVEQADERAGNAEGLATEAAAAAEQAAEARDDAARALAADWRDWATSATTQEILGAVDWATSAVARLLSDLEALVGDSRQPTLEELDQAAQAAAGPARLRLAGQLAGLDVANSNDEQRRRELESEQAALRADEDPEPEMVPWARTMPADAVPFWRCVDFTTEAEADEATRGAIEAALQASGLLTAGVGSGSSLTAADGQVLIGPSSPNARRPVTTLLRPDPESPVAAEIVEDVLSRIGLGPHGHSTWVDVDGRWGNGLLTGRYLADRPRHIGAAARQAAREARLAEIAADLDALAQAAEARRIERGRVEVDSARLDSHLLTKPSSGDLANRRWAARTTYDTAEKTWREAVRTRNEAEQRRQAWAQASDEHRRLCDHSNLPHTADELVDVERAASDSVTLCGRLATAIRTASTRRDLHRDELSRVETATGRRLAAEGKVHSAWRGWRDVAQQLERIREDFGTETDEIMRRIAEAKRTSAELEQQASAGRLKAQELTTKAAVTETEANQADANVLHERQVLADAVSHLRTQLTLPGIVEAATHGRPAVGSSDIEHVARLVTDLDDESPDLQRACRQLRETIEAGDSSAPVDENDLLKAQQTLDRELASSFDTVLSMVEGVRLFELIDADGRFPIALAARRIDERVEQARAALSEREYVVFSEYVVGGVADELRRRLGDADKLVKAMDTTLKGITTSQGIRVRLRWELLHDEASAIGRIRALCLKSSAFRSRPDTDELIQLLKERVTAEFETDPAAGYVAALESALDYRRWHHIDVKITRPGQEETAVNRRSRLSQGERRFVSYVVLFAAADTYFSSLPEAGKALRLITLDDAFAKVDDRTIAELLGLLVRLDLDFCLTGHALWGTYPEVPAVDVYEVRREAGLPAVTTHVHWDGRTRHLRPV